MTHTELQSLTDSGHHLTNDNHPSSFLAVCDAMEDIDKLLGWA